MKYLTEVSRERFGGGKNGRAINRHSTRLYQGKGNDFYEIDKTLDTYPPCYQVYDVIPGKTFVQSIKVNGQEYWGDGVSWKQAEEIAEKAILEWLRINEPDYFEALDL